MNIYGGKRRRRRREEKSTDVWIFRPRHAGQTSLRKAAYLFVPSLLSAAEQWWAGWCIQPAAGLPPVITPATRCCPSMLTSDGDMKEKVCMFSGVQCVQIITV